jgi:hypothetical protein
MLYDMGLIRVISTIINGAHVVNVAILFAIIPRAHYVTRSPVVEVNCDLFNYRVFSAHGPNH